MVLILEDEYASRISIGIIFEQYDIPFVSYENDGELLSDLQRNNLQNIDTAIIDLAGCNGIDMAIKLKKYFPEIFIIIISAYDAPDAVPATVINTFFKKPFSVLREIIPILQKRYPNSR
jgi:DNA-binding NtrC family response regulator